MGFEGLQQVVRQFREGQDRGRGRFRRKAAIGDQPSKYHFEAAIAYWHTVKNNEAERWQRILTLYNHLLGLEYSPIAALNRTYALAKVQGNEKAIEEA